jgi:hypothetical protein
VEIILIGGALIAVVLAFTLGAKIASLSNRSTLAKLLSEQARDRRSFLSAIQRELANILIWMDPQRFYQLYQSVMTEEAEIKNLTSSEANHRWDAFSEKYPDYQDFDIIGVRSYVLYPDTISCHDFESLGQAYRDISTFQALMIARDPFWRFFKGKNTEEANHLAGYARQVQDTKLRLDIELAVQQYYLSGKADDYAEFETDSFIVSPIPHLFEENRLGVVVKGTGEHGIYGFYVSDKYLPDGSPKIFHNYYRSDPTFQTTKGLRDLHAVADWRRSPSGRLKNGKLVDVIMLTSEY